MNIDNCLMTGRKQHELCQIIFKILNCHLLWVVNVNNGFLRVLVTESSLLEHYWNRKYYLQDPNIFLNPGSASMHPSRSAWRASLGSDCEIFKKSGFLYDLYKLFNIEEFVSIEKRIGLESYCFRFFTRNNRFIFMNKLLNNMSFIKCFMNATMEDLKIELSRKPGLSLVKLR